MFSRASPIWKICSDNSGNNYVYCPRNSHPATIGCDKISCDKISLTHKTLFRIFNPHKNKFLSISTNDYTGELLFRQLDACGDILKNSETLPQAFAAGGWTSKTPFSIPIPGFIPFIPSLNRIA